MSLLSVQRETFSNAQQKNIGVYGVPLVQTESCNQSMKLTYCNFHTTRQKLGKKNITKKERKQVGGT